MTGIQFLFKNKMFGYVKGFSFNINTTATATKRQLFNNVFGSYVCVYFSLENVLAENCLILSSWKNL